MAAATFLVLLIIVVELYRPIIIGDAIDRYINGYYTPYESHPHSGWWKSGGQLRLWFSLPGFSLDCAKCVLPYPYPLPIKRHPI